MVEKQKTDPTTDREPKSIPESTTPPVAREYGGPRGKEPTRYGDWEKNGRCVDF